MILKKTIINGKDVYEPISYEDALVYNNKDELLFTSDDEKDDYVRTISQTNLIRDPKDLNKITLIFVGTGFLRYMVRNMVGLLIEVGEGKRKSEEIISILHSEDRRTAG